MFKRKRAALPGARLTAESDQVIAAMCRSQAMIEFKLDGTIIWANENFLATMGYTLEEIVGKHHAIFVDPKYAAGPDYARFWDELAKGQFAQAEYRRVAKDGKDVWIQASYNPIMDKDGKPVQVIKFATDITAQKRAAADADGRLSAISASQAVIEFDLDGHILTANENFCSALGYRLEEIAGRHHSLFVDPAEAASAEYAAFWARLRAGHFDTAEYRRVGKNGEDVWIQASYNPIFDPAGVPYKVVKYATDISARKRAVKLIGAQLEGMAEGRLADRLDTEMPGELEDIRLAVKRTTCQFSAIVERLVRTSRGMREATAEILSGANDLGERTNKQATSVAQTSAAVEQLGTTVQENAERARQAREKSNHASTQAQETGTVMGSANLAMEEISKSSKKISNIIGMIDDIAFQTNLLALNASVEAARAGEAGKGFAVVAIEVRRLAQSAASASADIKLLIEASGKEVANGTKLVSGASQKVNSLLSEITQSTALVDAIAHATSEQAETIRKVALAIRHIDEMTQHNSALVEETNAAIEQTENQARHLDSIVETFTLAPATTEPRTSDTGVVRLRAAS